MQEMHPSNLCCLLPVLRSRCYLYDTYPLLAYTAVYFEAIEAIEAILVLRVKHASLQFVLPAARAAQLGSSCRQKARFDHVITPPE